MIRFIMGDIIMTVHSMVQLRGDHLLQAMKRDVNEQATQNLQLGFECRIHHDHARQRRCRRLARSCSTLWIRRPQVALDTVLML